MLQCVAVRCSVLQCAAVCCSVLQCVAVWCSVLQCVAERCNVLQCGCSVLQCAVLGIHVRVGLKDVPHLFHISQVYVAVCCSVL